MSGTSLDGIDAALVDFSNSSCRLVHATSRELPAQLRAELLALTQPGDNEIERLGRTDITFARLQADLVRQLLTAADIPHSAVAAIGSHGQTIRHRPCQDPAFTIQLGDPNCLAELSGIDVVADFRRRDIAAGGQGAPLVPAFHAQCFRSTSIDRAILNLGGVANITLLPKAPTDVVSGFDTGPANVLMDAWSQRHLNQPFDRNGSWAERGRIVPELLQRLLSEGYFIEPAPKSTGRELFHIGWVDHHLDQLETIPEPQDVQATLLELTATSVAAELRRHPLPIKELYLCGGGAHNLALVKRLSHHLPQLRIASTERLGLHPDWVEAIAFAWLAKRFVDRQPGNLPAVTGASGPRILGTLSPAGLNH